MALFGTSEESLGVEVPPGLGKALETVVAARKKKTAVRLEGRSWSYQELDEQASRVAGGLRSLGIGRGDRVAIMLPNIPEFVFTFFGIQKLGGVAVPFNTTYKGREISFILQDSGAKAIVCLTSYANLINEIRSEAPTLEHVIVTGQRTLVFSDPDATVNVQLVLETSRFASSDEAFHAVGNALVSTFREFGATDAWYKHQGAVRAAGKKLATIVMSEIEGLYVVNVVTFLSQMNTEPLFKVIYVPPEIKERAVEPTTSIEELTGTRPSLDEFRSTFRGVLEKSMGVTIQPGELTRDEVLAYQKNRTLAGRDGGSRTK